MKRISTDIVIKGDKVIEQIPSIRDKALRINLNENIYGSFSEIGAGQETVRHFFRAGGASGTIAKAMSAYDKVFSDAIYGTEEAGRYVTEGRLKKMLEYEMELMQERLDRKSHPNKLFFCYANTVTTIDFAKKFKGHGWVGIKFQTEPDQDFNDIILHVRFKENDSRLQQETLGVLGVNLIYSAFYKYNDPKRMLDYLYDHLEIDQIEIDTINFSGPLFKNTDNRLMSLQLVKKGMTDAVMFGPDGKSLLPAAVLYKKSILVHRGSFRPVTKVNMDIINKAHIMFENDPKVLPQNTLKVFEITLSNLRSEGEINEKDFLDRAEILCSLGETVMISNFQEYYKLVDYLALYTKEVCGLAMGVNNLYDIFDSQYYEELSGGILSALGAIFTKDIRVYVYPLKEARTGEMITTQNLKIHPRIIDLYKYFISTGKIKDIDSIDHTILDVFSRDILKRIMAHEEGWENKLPDGVGSLIKKQKLFGYKKEKIVFDETEEFF
jgi:hypothetical protein